MIMQSETHSWMRLFKVVTGQFAGKSIVSLARQRQGLPVSTLRREIDLTCQTAHAVDNSGAMMDVLTSVRPSSCSNA